MNYFSFIDNMKLPIINNLQYFTMTTYLESELLLAVQRLKEKFPNLKMTSIIYKGKLVHNQLPFNVIAILYNIFFSSYECSSKYNKFKNISFKQNFSENSENSSENNQDNKDKEKKEIKKEKEEIKENKDEIKEEKKEEIKENNNEIKEEKKEEIKENKDKIKEEKKEEIKEENRDEIKVSPYRKILNIKNVPNQFLTGVLIDSIDNSYNFFIPKIYIKELNFEEYSMIIYLAKGILFFLFFDKDLIIEQQIEKISKIPMRINKYFGAQFENIFKLDKPILDNNIFCYKNENNKSIKFSGFIKKNNNAFDWKLFEQLQKAFFINSDTEMTSITKSKGYYTYFINSIGQEVVLIFKDNLTLTQLKQEIEKIKKIYFGNLFLN